MIKTKAKDQEKMYLFRCGNFYIFLADDADFINNYVVLKRTKFTKDVMKCGFPIGSKDEYFKGERREERERGDDVIIL